MKSMTVDQSALRLAQGFAAQVRRWALALHASEEAAGAAAHAAEAASLATSAGHTCASLGEVFDALPAAQARERVLASHVVTTPTHLDAVPLVLDDEGRLYLHRYFDYERRLAARLLAAAQAPFVPPAPKTAQRLASLFPYQGDAAESPVDWQRVAAALALVRKLTVISGGPGTGKTTTVVNLLACLLEQNPDCRIAMAAPTGKAAARMLEAVSARSARLPEALRSRLPHEAQTIHRLLGVTAGGDRFRHYAANPLPLDVLVVDEASMLDLSLATRLLEAVPPEARIILLGDKDQLASVEAGAVFAEIGADPTLDPSMRAALARLVGVEATAVSPPSPAAPSPLRNATVWLTQTYRFSPDSGLGQLAGAINRGDADLAVHLLASPSDGSLQFLAGDSELLARVREGYAPFVDAVCTHPADVARVSTAFEQFRVLCATREGARGAQRLNEHGERLMRASLIGGQAGAGGSPWYPGRPVMVLRNDYVLKLFNGDVGIALPDANGELHVHFPLPDGTFRSVAPARLPEHETAFAVTVHKAQGSEFDKVTVVLPEGPNRVLTRELLYTAVTRSRKQVTVCGPAEMVRLAVQTPTRRHSGAIARMRELAAQT